MSSPITYTNGFSQKLLRALSSGQAALPSPAGIWAADARRRARRQFLIGVIAPRSIQFAGGQAAGDLFENLMDSFVKFILTQVIHRAASSIFAQSAGSCMKKASPLASSNQIFSPHLHGRSKRTNSPGFATPEVLPQRFGCSISWTIPTEMIWLTLKSL